ncbi:MAG: TetR-like C-terminal domain-containing protein [Acidimicrobiales bacterium]
MTDPARETLTREAVLAASRDLIERDGLDNLSLRRRCRARGHGAGAVRLRDRQARPAARGRRSGIRRTPGALRRRRRSRPRQRLRQLSRAYVDYAAENPELFKTMFIFPPEIDFGGATGEELPIATQAFTFAVDSIRDAVAAGEIRDDLDPLLITFTSWVSTHGLAMVLNLGFVLDAPTRDLLIDLVLDTVLKGLEPDAG